MVRVFGGSKSIASRGRADAEAARLEQIRVQRPHRHASLDEGNQQRILEQALRSELAVHQPGDRSLLAGDPAHVGVHPNLTEERAIGVRYRLRAHRDDAGAAVAVRQLLKAPLDVARARTHPGRDGHPVDAETRKLRAYLGLDEPGRGSELGLLAHGWLASIART